MTHIYHATVSVSQESGPALHGSLSSESLMRLQPRCLCLGWQPPSVSPTGASPHGSTTWQLAFPKWVVEGGEWSREPARWKGQSFVTNLRNEGILLLPHSTCYKQVPSWVYPWRGENYRSVRTPADGDHWGSSQKVVYSAWHFQWVLGSTDFPWVVDKDLMLTRMWASMNKAWI